MCVRIKWLILCNYIIAFSVSVHGNRAVCASRSLQRMQFLHAHFFVAVDGDRRCVCVFWNYFIIFYSFFAIVLFVSWKTCSLPEGWIANVLMHWFGCVHGYFSNWAKVSVRLVFRPKLIFRSITWKWHLALFLLQNITFSHSMSCMHIIQLIKSSKLIQNLQVLFLSCNTLEAMIDFPVLICSFWLLLHWKLCSMSKWMPWKTFKRVILLQTEYNESIFLIRIIIEMRKECLISCIALALVRSKTWKMKE